MSLISKEKQQDTYTLLKSAPITLLQLVWAKLLTSLVIILLMTALINIMILLLSIGTKINYVLLFSCTIAFIMFNLSIASIGLFLSSLTKQPIIAGISTLGLLLLTLLFGWNTEQSSGLLSILSLHTHYNALLEASIESSDLLYLLFITALMFSWTVFKLSSESWRH